MSKCANCGKVCKKPIFLKGKFFCCDSCVGKFKKKAAKSKKKNVCEFC